MQESKWRRKRKSSNLVGRLIYRLPRRMYLCQRTRIDDRRTIRSCRSKGRLRILHRVENDRVYHWRCRNRSRGNHWEVHRLRVREQEQRIQRRRRRRTRRIVEDYQEEERSDSGGIVEGRDRQERISKLFEFYRRRLSNSRNRLDQHQHLSLQYTTVHQLRCRPRLSLSIAASDQRRLLPFHQWPPFEFERVLSIVESAWLYRRVMLDSIGCTNEFRWGRNRVVNVIR